MKPKDLMLKNLQDHLLQDLERNGFKFVENKIAFYKNFGVLKLNFCLELERYNHGEECRFKTKWSISADSYRKWYFDEWGVNPDSFHLIELEGPEVPGWTARHDMVLTGDDQDERVMEELKENVFEVGIPYFMEYTYWDTVAEYLLKLEAPKYAKACDCYLMYNEDVKARNALEKGILELKVGLGRDRENELPEIEKRLRKYFSN